MNKINKQKIHELSRAATETEAFEIFVKNAKMQKLKTMVFKEVKSQIYQK